MVIQNDPNHDILSDNCHVHRNDVPKISDIENARKILNTYGIGKTPLIKSNTLSKYTGNNVYLKIESLQATGTFKSRGAFYKVDKILRNGQIKNAINHVVSTNERNEDHESKDENSQGDQLFCGVIAASAGNHAQGVAYAAATNNIPCTIVMPTNVHPSKINATKGYGAKVILEGKDYDDSLSYSKTIAKKERLYQIHAYDDYDIISGQGTIGLELLEDLPNVDEIYIPIGGGGLASGIALAVKSNKPSVKIIGIESTAYPSIKESLAKGIIHSVNRGKTIADSISIKSPGILNYRILKEHLDAILLVHDVSIRHAMHLLMEREKLVVEPAGAVGVAHLLESKRTTNTDSSPRSLDPKNVVIILSGGNVDMNLLSQVAMEPSRKNY